ncbi:MAG: asparagine synthase-related protein [Pseudomonadota bacterium]
MPKRVFEDHGAIVATDGSAFVHHDAERKLVIVGEWRLDHDPTINLNSDPRHELRKIAFAYSSFGLDLCSVLEGEFSFAVWDGLRRELVLARDQLGARQMYFREEKHAIVFSNLARTASRGEKAKVTKADVASFLLGIPPSSKASPFPDVQSVRAAHIVRWSYDEFRHHRYWNLELRIDSTKDAPAKFRSLFKDAVRRRMNAQRPCAAMLSGGLDSSSIAMVAGAIRETSGGARLATFSHVYPDHPDLDESHYIDAVLRDGYIEGNKIPFIGGDPLEGMAEAQVGLGRICEAVRLEKVRQICRLAKSNGYDVVLDGNGGDEVVSYGLEHLVALARASNWLKVIPLLKAQAEMAGSSRLAVLAGLVSIAPATFSTRQLRRSLTLFRNQSNSQKRLDFENFLAPQLLAETNVLEEWKKARSWKGSEDDFAREFHLRAMQSDAVPQTLEVLSWAGRQEGVELRCPFYDKRLIEFCVSLPGSEKIAPDATRALLRRALHGILPNEVALRRDKKDYAGEAAEGLVRHHRERLKELVAGIPKLRGVFAQNMLSTAVKNVLEFGPAADGLDVVMTWRALCLLILVEDNCEHFDAEF